MDAPTVADRILAAVRAKGAAMSPREVHEAVGGSYDTVRSTLISLRDKGDLTQPTRGAYALPDPRAADVERMRAAEAAGDAYLAANDPHPAADEHVLFYIDLPNGAVVTARLVIERVGLAVGARMRPGKLAA